ncbi:MAG TPA: hypothetical protein VF365_02430 [Candidatus Limnocylindria bacterium]
MSTDRDTTRIVRSWLTTDENESADRILGTVLDRLDTTPQRRATWWLARRFSDMHTFAKVAIAAAAVVALLLVGIVLLPGSRPSVGEPDASASASALPSVPPTPSEPSPTPDAAFPPTGELAIGTHRVTLSGVRVIFDLTTDGWVSNGSFGIDKGRPEAPESAGFIFWSLSAPDTVFADPCTGVPLSPAPEPSIAALAAAVASLPGTELVIGPTEVTVGGYPAQHVAIMVPDDIGCEPNEFYLWEDTDNPGQARYATDKGSTIHTWIIDVDGRLVWIDGETYAASDPAAEREILEIIGSIRFRQDQGPG